MTFLAILQASETYLADTFQSPKDPWVCPILWLSSWFPPPTFSSHRHSAETHFSQLTSSPPHPRFPDCDWLYYDFLLSWEMFSKWKWNLILSLFFAAYLWSFSWSWWPFWYFCSSMNSVSAAGGVRFSSRQPPESDLRDEVAVFLVVEQSMNLREVLVQCRRREAKALLTTSAY